jgi:hypothetical protein
MFPERLIMFKIAPVVVALFTGCMLLGGVVRAADDPKVEEKEGWVSLFDGKSLNGWKANENTQSFKVEDGALVAHGNRSHLFYTGDDKPFTNFEFSNNMPERQIVTRGRAPAINSGNSTTKKANTARRADCHSKLSSTH